MSHSKPASSVSAEGDDGTTVVMHSTPLSAAMSRGAGGLQKWGDQLKAYYSRPSLVATLRSAADKALRYEKVAPRAAGGFGKAGAEPSADCPVPIGIIVCGPKTLINSEQGAILDARGNQSSVVFHLHLEVVEF